jgi:hypothetical protein
MKPAASDFATSPDPKIPIFMIAPPVQRYQLIGLPNQVGLGGEGFKEVALA